MATAQLTTLPQKSNVQICFTPDDIVSIKSDVMVSSIHRSRNLSIGYLSSHINKTGGPEISKELKKNPTELEFSQIVRTGPGKLISKCLLFVCLDHWREGNEDAIRQCVYDCLIMAAVENHTSIAFPALGMGGLKYKPYISASMIMTALHQYFDDHPDSSIKTVYICVQNKDDKLVQSFVDHCLAFFLLKMGDDEDPAIQIVGVEKCYKPINKVARTSSPTATQASGVSALPGLVVDAVSRVLPLIVTKGCVQLGGSRNSTSPVSCSLQPGFNPADKTLRLQADIQVSIPKFINLFTRK